MDIEPGEPGGGEKARIRKSNRAGPQSAESRSSLFQVSTPIRHHRRERAHFYHAAAVTQTLRPRAGQKAVDPSRVRIIALTDGHAGFLASSQSHEFFNSIAKK
jgi:hypothetical protein